MQAMAFVYTFEWRLPAIGVMAHLPSEVPPGSCLPDACHCVAMLLNLIAVKGSNYCSSAARAVQLIVSNALRLAAVNVVGDAMLFLGKLGVAACCGVVAFAMSNLEYYNNADKYPATYLSSGILPIAVAVLAGYIVAQVGCRVHCTRQHAACLPALLCLPAACGIARALDARV